MILLPGNGWTGAATFVSSGSLAALSAITNLDGSKTNLIFDVHKYLDFDGSGQNFECVTNNINDAFAPLATALRNAGRQALLSETGGGNSASCVKLMCEQLAYINANADVYLGYVGVSFNFNSLCWWGGVNYADDFRIVVSGCVPAFMELCAYTGADVEWEYMDGYAVDELVLQEIS